MGGEEIKQPPVRLRPGGTQQIWLRQTVNLALQASCWPLFSPGEARFWPQPLLQQQQRWGFIPYKLPPKWVNYSRRCVTAADRDVSVWIGRLRVPNSRFPRDGTAAFPEDDSRVERLTVEMLVRESGNVREGTGKTWGSSPPPQKKRKN